MAVTTQPKVPFGALRGPYVLSLYLLGLAAVFVGERIIGGETTTRFVLSGIGAALVFLGCVLWLLAWLRTKEEHRRVERLAALFALGGLAGLILYLVGSDLILGPAPVTKGEAGVGIRQVLAVAWPAVLVCTVLPLVFVQWSAASMAGGRGVEPTRVQNSARAGAVTAMLLCTLFFVNAIADRKDIHGDLSYFKTTSPSESSQELVRGMDQDTQALLFFPSPNEVLSEVLPYFEQLQGFSPRFSVQVVDRALDPELAEEHRVSRDGTVVLTRGKSRQKIDLGEKLDRARRKLRKLDGEFQKAVLKLTLERQTVYMVAGHGERSAVRVEGDNRSRLSVLKKILTDNNMTVKNLSLVEGLAREVPDDAALVLWMDPQAPLMPGEDDALKAYLAGGGRMLITLDPDSQPGIDEFLGHVGIKFVPEKLAHGKFYVPLKRMQPASYNLVTNAFSSHPSVSRVSRYRQYMPVLVPRAGSLAKAEGTKRKVTFTMRSLPQTFADADGDGKRAKEERLKTFQLVAAVSEKVKKAQNPDKDKDKDKGKDEEKEEVKGKAKDEKDKDKKDKKDKDKKDKDKRDKKKGLTVERDEEMRVVVAADTDLFADDYVGFRVEAVKSSPNLELLGDVLRWLIGEAKIGGVPTTEEDQKIRHTRDDDYYWFYATVFAVPLLILGTGVGTRWGRGRGRRAGR